MRTAMKIPVSHHMTESERMIWLKTWFGHDTWYKIGDGVKLPTDVIEGGPRYRLFGCMLSNEDKDYVVARLS